MTVRDLPPNTQFRTEFGVPYLLLSVTPSAARVRALSTRHVAIKRDDGSVTEFDRKAGEWSISPGTAVSEVFHAG